MFSKDQNCFKIIDFGVSAYLDYYNYSIITQVGETPAGGDFIDPLLKANPQLIDQRSDIYSLGCIWYFLLCHRHPVGSNIIDTLKNTNPEISTNEIDFIFKCFKYEIDERYYNCKTILTLIYNNYYDIIEPIYYELPYQKKRCYIKNSLIFSKSKHDGEHINCLIDMNDNLSNKILQSSFHDNKDKTFKSYVVIGEVCYFAIRFSHKKDDEWGDLIIDYHYCDYLPQEKEINDIFAMAKQKENHYKECTRRNCYTQIYIVANKDILREMSKYYYINHYLPGIFLLDETNLDFVAGGEG